MAKENETVADIIAEMRKYATDYYGRTIENGGEKGNPGMFYCDMAQFAKVNADRLEAAHKREVDALSEQIADLSQQRDLWSKRAAELVEKCNEHYAKMKQVGNAAKLREALIKLRSAIYRDEDGDAHIAPDIIVENIIDTALSAPPRNCDVYNNESCRMAYHLHGDGLMTMQAFADWLFAPATEKEGDAK